MIQEENEMGEGREKLNDRQEGGDSCVGVGWPAGGMAGGEGCPRWWVEGKRRGE